MPTHPAPKGEPLPRVVERLEREHRCGLCYGPFGKSAIRCKNEPKEADRG